MGGNDEEFEKRFNVGDFLFYFVAVFLLIICVATAIKHHYDFNTPNTPAGILEDAARIPAEWVYTFSTWQQAYQFSKLPVLPEFDNKADNQTIQAGINAVPISKRDLPALLENSIKPVEENKFPDITILLPIRLSDGEKAIIGTDWMQRVTNPINPASKDPLAYGKTIIVGKKGTEIIIPADNATVSVSLNETGLNVLTYTIIFYGPDGTEYDLLISTPQDISLLAPTSLIKNAITDKNTSNLSFSIGTPIAATSADRVKIVADMFAYPPGYGHSRLGIPCNFKFIEKANEGKIAITFLQ